MLGFKNTSPQTEDGGARGKGAWGQPWQVTGVLCLLGRPGKLLGARAQTDCGSRRWRAVPAVVRRSHLGIWVQLWNLNPKSRAAAVRQGHLKFRHL